MTPPPRPGQRTSGRQEAKVDSVSFDTHPAVAQAGCITPSRAVRARRGIIITSPAALGRCYWREYVPAGLAERSDDVVEHSWCFVPREGSPPRARRCRSAGAAALLPRRLHALPAALSDHLSAPQHEQPASATEVAPRLHPRAYADTPPLASARQRVDIDARAPIPLHADAAARFSAASCLCLRPPAASCANTFAPVTGVRDAAAQVRCKPKSVTSNDLATARILDCVTQTELRAAAAGAHLLVCPRPSRIQPQHTVRPLNSAGTAQRTTRSSGPYVRDSARHFRARRSSVNSTRVASSVGSTSNRCVSSPADTHSNPKPSASTRA